MELQDVGEQHAKPLHVPEAGEEFVGRLHVLQRLPYLPSKYAPIARSHSHMKGSPVFGVRPMSLAICWNSGDTILISEFLFGLDPGFARRSVH